MIVWVIVTQVFSVYYLSATTTTILAITSHTVYLITAIVFFFGLKRFVKLTGPLNLPLFLLTMFVWILCKSYFAQWMAGFNLSGQGRDITIDELLADLMIEFYVIIATVLSTLVCKIKLISSTSTQS